MANGALINTLQPKAVRYGIKHGTSIEEFCEKYDCDTAAFEARIRIIFSHGHEQVLKDIIASAAKHHKKSTLTTTATEAPAEEPVAASGEEISTSDTEAPTELSDAQPTLQEKLTELKAREAAESDIIMDIENQHKAARQAHNTCTGKMIEISKEIDQIETKLRKKVELYRNLVIENNEHIARMNDLSGTRREHKTILDGIRAQISELNTISIGVYRDGTISVFDEEVTMDLDDTGHEELFQAFATREECEDFAIRDIKTIARLMKIIEHSEVTLEIIFESDELEFAYQLLSEKPENTL